MEPSDPNTPKPPPAPSSFARQWHHRPPVPIKVSPFFSWPPDPRRMLKWVADRWFSIAENSILLGVAMISWFWFQPPLEESRVLAFGWIAEIYIRNLILLLIVAGGLHLYFHRWKQQGQTLKFD
ncbi:MAG: sterol desaturase family protein, partial [Albidovulum sp.]